MLIVSLSMNAQDNKDSLDKKPVVQKPKSDSASSTTPLLSLEDFVDLETYLKDKMEVKDFRIVVRYDLISAWILERYSTRAREFNSKLKPPKK